MIIVIGAPCSGKSTYVDEHRNDGDVVVDLDRIATALGSDSPHGASGSIKDVAIHARQSVIDYLIDADVVSWVVHSMPSADQMQVYSDAGCSFIVIDPGLDVCLSRCDSDDRPEGTSELINRWYESVSQYDAFKGALLADLLELRKVFSHG